MIAESTINAIRDLNIEDVLSPYIKLEHKGSSLKGCCPFHNENTPSFNVSTAKNFYKCFGCGASGDAIKFVQELNHLSFYEAIERIANDHGIAVEEERSNKTPEEREAEKSKKEKANELLHAANGLFMSNKSQIDYLIETRKLTQETIDEWQIGFAGPEFHKLEQVKLISNDTPLAIEISLLNQKGDKLFDFFINRITIPIRNHIGQIVSFGGRELPSTEKTGVKYLNGKDSFLYNKSNLLFGLDKAAKSIKENDFAYLTEGYFDVIKMYQSGKENTIGTCGTALTDKHCKLLKRYTHNVTLMRDGDSAGIKATEKDIVLLLKEGFEVGVFELPEGQDPDDFCNDKDTIEFEAAFNFEGGKQKDGVKWLLERMRIACKSDSLFIERSADLLACINSDLSRSLYVEWMTKQFKLVKKIILDAIKFSFSKNNPINEPTTTSDVEKMPDWVSLDKLYTEGFVMNNNPELDRIGIYFKGESKPVTRLTNYVILPLFFIMDPMNSRRLVEVNNGRRSNVVELPNKAFTGQETFETELVARGAYYSEPGFSKMHYKRLVNWLSDNMLNVHTLKTLGWQPEGFFAFSNMAIKASPTGIDKLQYDEYGIVKIDDKAFLSEGVSKLNADTRAEDNIYENDLYLKYVEAPVKFYEWAELFCQVYDEDGMFGIAFIFIAAFKDIVTKVAKCPHLYCYGPKGSGKSEFAESLMYFFFSGKNADGKLIQGYNLNPGQGTPFSFFSRQQRFRNVLMLFNEYDPNSIEFWKKGAFKSSYDGEGREIGSGETGKKRKTEIQKAQCVSIIAGQYLDTTDDGAVLSRSIPCKFSLEKNKTRPDEQKNSFRKLKEMEQSGLSSIVADIIQFRKNVQQELKDVYWATQKELNDTMRKEGHQVEVRLLSNYSLVISMAEVLGKQLTFPFKIEKLKLVAKKRMLAQATLLRDNNALNSFWNVVENLFDDGQLVDGIHFKKQSTKKVLIQNGNEKRYRDFEVSTKLLFIRFNTIYERFAKRYREVYNKTAPDQDTLLVYLNDQNYFVGLCPVSSFKDKKTSSYVLYYDVLAETQGLNFEKDGGTSDEKEQKVAETTINPIVQDDMPF